MTKPDEGRGWEILNGIADQLPEAIRDEFLADARLYEGAFTGGHISEGQFMEVIKRLLVPFDKELNWEDWKNLREARDALQGDK